MMESEIIALAILGLSFAAVVVPVSLIAILKTGKVGLKNE